MITAVYARVLCLPNALSLGPPLDLSPLELRLMLMPRLRLRLFRFRLGSCTPKCSLLCGFCAFTSFASGTRACSTLALVLSCFPIPSKKAKKVCLCYFSACVSKIVMTFFCTCACRKTRLLLAKSGYQRIVEPSWCIGTASDRHFILRLFAFPIFIRP